MITATVAYHKAGVLTMSGSFLRWVGGKSRLAKTIISMIPEHTGYVEVFAGASWVLFKKEESKSEVINDINKELTTLYRVIQHHLDEFVRYFRWSLVSRDEFDRLNRTDSNTLTDIQRAARFYYVAKMCFGGRAYRSTFGVSTTSKPRLNLSRIEDDLSAAHLRLCRTTIECLPYQDLIARYDRPDTFFYIDPPYWGCENHYGKDIFSQDDFSILATILSKIKGKFILSINDTPEIRAIFEGFKCRTAETKYTLGNADNRKAVRELLYRNF